MGRLTVEGELGVAMVASGGFLSVEPGRRSQVPRESSGASGASIPWTPYGGIPWWRTLSPPAEPQAVGRP